MRFSARTRPAPTGQCQFSASALARRVTERNRSATSPWGWPVSWCHAVGGHILARIGTSRRRQVRPRGPRAFDQGTALRAVLPCGLPPCSHDALVCASRRAIAGAGDAALCNLPRCSTARVPSTSVSWPRWRHTHAAARALPGWCDARNLFSGHRSTGVKGKLFLCKNLPASSTPLSHHVTFAATVEGDTSQPGHRGGHGYFGGSSSAPVAGFEPDRRRATRRRDTRSRKTLSHRLPRTVIAQCRPTGSRPGPTRPPSIPEAEPAIPRPTRYRSA